jgi:hypothetical protein
MPISGFLTLPGLPANRCTETFLAAHSVDPSKKTNSSFSALIRASGFPTQPTVRHSLSMFLVWILRILAQPHALTVIAALPELPR